MAENPQVTEYIEKLDSPKRDICAALRTMLQDDLDGLIEEYKWSRPVYRSESGPVCYIQAAKAHVNFGFNRGAELDDPDGVLEGTGKDMRHIKLRTMDDVNRDQLAGFVQQAINLEPS